MSPNGPLLFAALVALGLFAGACSGEPSRPKVVLVALDGATWDVIDPMIEAGELPNFERLVARGARGRLLSIPPLSSPVVWTSVATGTFARSHGILGFTYPFTSGRGRPVGADLRKDPAIWNIASAHGVPTGTIGWFASHPPDRVDGFLISDRAHQGVGGAAFPERLQADVRARFERVNARRGRDLERFFPWDYDPSAADDPAHPHHAVTSVVRGRVDDVVLRDETYKALALDLVNEPVDLLACYFRVIDHASHAAWSHFEPDAFDDRPSAADVELLRDLIPEAYRWADELLGELLAACDGEVNLFVVSDHGFGPGPRDLDLAPENNVMSGDHRIHGIFLAAGPDVRAGRVEGLTTLDVAPILLTLLGLPVSDELPGRVEPALFREGYLDDHPVRRVDAYDVLWTSGPGGSVPEAAEEEALETLEALGYIESGEGVGRSGSEAELDFWSVDHSYRAAAVTGELLFLELRGQEALARDLLEQVRRHDPRLAREAGPRVRAAENAVAKDVGRAAGRAE